MKRTLRKQRFALFVLTIFLVITCFQKAEAQNPKPNIILILSDDVGYKSLSCNGGTLYSTPNIDTLAQQGMRFTQCHASPLCSPSRFMLLTGKYNFRNYGRWGELDPNAKTIGNLMKDAGYRTGFFGKDQLDGAGQSVNSWGFDEYCIYDPLNAASSGSRYKNPHIYTHGAFLPDSATINKYGPDIVSDSVLRFLDNNKSNPFFIYYPVMLVHSPFSPTPDDTAFANWNPDNPDDTSFFASMMLYMDKKIGEVRAKLKDLGIENNTVLIFTSDNGAPRAISDYVNDDSSVAGGKGRTTEEGINVPLIIDWPGTVAEGAVNDDLIGFTDFLPTLADIANVHVSTDYNPLDGVSFFPPLVGQSGTPRDWLFTHYDPHPGKGEMKRWAQTATYKLYDTSASKPERRFYNMINDPNEKFPIADSSLTAAEDSIRQELLAVLNYYVAQGLPALTMEPSILRVTDVSVVLKDTIVLNGGSTVTASGAVWSTHPNPEISLSDHTESGAAWGPFYSLVTGLNANTRYYIRAYATNSAGTAYNNEIVFQTLESVVATPASAIGVDQFTANWNAYAGATGYRLDVSTSPTFTRLSAITRTEGFDSGIVPPAGWTISPNIIANTTDFKIASPSLEFIRGKAQVVTKTYPAPATQLSFWIKGINTRRAGALLVEGYDGNTWTVIKNITKLPLDGGKQHFDTTSIPPLPPNLIRFRFTYTKKTDDMVLDDVSVNYTAATPSFVSIYHDLPVDSNFKTVTGLKPATGYYYRVRAITDAITTGNSNVINTTTGTAPRASAVKSASMQTGDRITEKIHQQADVFPNPASTEFTLTIETSTNERFDLIVTDGTGKLVYHASGIQNGKYVFGRNFGTGVYFARITGGEFSKTIKIIKANK